ncbi:MAG TPA: hypothetical protein VKB77_04330 [Terriglobales bacterium]|nr:hypothetical protein [Terriglobales bacterium]
MQVIRVEACGDEDTPLRNEMKAAVPSIDAIADLLDRAVVVVHCSRQQQFSLLWLPGAQAFAFVP